MAVSPSATNKANSGTIATMIRRRKVMAIVLVFVRSGYHCFMRSVRSATYAVFLAFSIQRARSMPSLAAASSIVAVAPRCPDMLGFHLVQRRRLTRRWFIGIRFPICEGNSPTQFWRRTARIAPRSMRFAIPDVARPRIAEQGIAHRIGKSRKSLAGLPGEKA